MTTLAELDTPCLIVDRAKVEANAKRMRERAERFSVSLRPHLKTTKSAEIAKIAHGGNVGPITVSTLREAEYFLAAGFTDIVYAVCLSPNKFDRAAKLTDRGADLKLLVDNEAIVTALARFSAGRPRPLKILIEIDCGDHRTGIDPEDDALVRTAALVSSADGLLLEGLLTHGGHSYGAKTTAAIAAVAEEERVALHRAKERLADEGIEVSTLSSGSTPTAMLGKDYRGLSELRPGVYLAGDLFQAGLATCTIDDIAISVLASVIAHAPARNELVIDAGGLALSKDRSTEHSPADYGYGLVVREDGSRFEADLIVRGVSQEHGQISAETQLPFDALPVGSQVRVLPNHVCMTAASYDRYHVVEGSEVLAEWDKATGW